MPRKGQQAAATQSKRSRETPFVKEVEEPLSPLTEVPSTEDRAEPTPASDSEPGESDVEFNYELPEIWLTRELLESMRRFDDQKRAATYKERCSAGKMAKSGKQYSSEELKIIDSDEEFRACIYAIGF